MSAGLIEKLQRISNEIFQQSLKTYKLKDVIVHKRAHTSNLIQSLSLYPNKGITFKVKRKTWNQGTYILISDAKYKSNRLGTLYGTKYINNQQFHAFPMNLQGCNKRGVWQYQLGDFKQFQTDNGLRYTRQDYQAFYNMRRSSIQKEQQTGQNAASEQAQTIQQVIQQKQEQK